MRRPLLLSLCVSALLGSPLRPARAGEYHYPEAAPVLGVTLPDGWSATEQEGPALLLLCTPPGEASYTVSLMTLPVVGNQDDLAHTLAQIVKAGAQGAGMTEVVVSKATEEAVGKNPRLFTKITASGQHNDEPSAFTFYAFRLPSTGRTYAVGVAGVQAMIDAHRTDFEELVKSLTPISASGSASVHPASPPKPTPELTGPSVELNPKRP